VTLNYLAISWTGGDGGISPVMKFDGDVYGLVDYRLSIGLSPSASF